jgi:hypothetical protein
MRRRKLIAAVGLAVVLAAGLAWAWYDTNRTGRVSRANYQRIQDGMTLERVEALLGGPPYLELRPGDGPKTVDFSGVPDDAPPGTLGRKVDLLRGDKRFEWHASDRFLWIWVGFTNGRVVSKNVWDPSL